MPAHFVTSDAFDQLLRPHFEFPNDFGKVTKDSITWNAIFHIL